MKKLITLFLLAAATQAFSQDWPIKKIIMDTKAKKVAFVNIPAFTFIANKTLPGRGTYQELRLNSTFSNQLLKQRPEAIQVKVPLNNSKSITCELVKFSLGNILVTENNEQVIENLKVPVTYRGIMAGTTGRNTVILTVNEEYLSLVATTADGVIQVTKADEKNNSTYRLYNSTKVQFPIVPFDCGTKEKPAPQSDNGIQLNGIKASPLAVQDKCLNVFVDCFDSLYINQNRNTQQTINFVYELFNSVATGYFNDSVNIQITTVNVWTTMDPYRGDTRSNALYDLANYWKDNFWGNICVGLDFGANGRSGVADDIGRVKAVSANTCPAFDYSGSNSFSACCYNDLNYNVSVQNFPTGPNTTQQQVYLVMHEMGHLLGAHHTKWCGWKLTSNPDSYGTIDSCGVIEPVNNSTPVCSQGPPPPPNGATIMSYCVTSMLNGNFVGYYNGFGKLPGNAIRNFIDQSTCILNCIDCFGVRNTSNKELYAFQNNTPVMKKENPAGEDNSHGQTKKPPTAGNQFINTQKIKR